MFLLSKRCIGLKSESSPYTQPQADLQQVDFNFRAYNVKYSPAIEEAKRIYATGNMSRFASIMGKRGYSASFSIDMAWSGDVDTPPEWGLPLKHCGYKETIYASSGVGYTVDSGYTSVPCVIEIREMDESGTKQLIIKLRGAMGNVKIILDSVGKPVRMDFEFKGAIQEIKDTSSVIVPAGYPTTLPDAVLDTAITAFTETLDLDKVTIDTGNKTEIFPDSSMPEGISGARIVDRESKLQIDPYLALQATRANWSRLTTGTTGAFAMPIGDHLAMAIPAIQIIKGFDGADRSGGVVNTLDCNILGSTGASDIEILQGAKS